MDIEQVGFLVESGKLPGKSANTLLKETHISWVILNDDHVYKIKRPVKYSFVDFSTLEKREFYCNEELRLNRRLAPEMYMDVIPVTGEMIGRNNEKRAEIIDFAVQMKRMDNSLEMDSMLKENRVETIQIDRLARKIAAFHERAEIIRKPINLVKFAETFADIRSVIPFLKKNGKKGAAEKITACIERSEDYIEKNSRLFSKRVNGGYIRDCHGDLNSSNIFLYDDPVIFDCIEFNEELRHIDIINEIAFLCTELDFFGKNDLGELFYRKYLDYSGLDENRGNSELFRFYKSYRANIRAKVTLLSAENSNEGDKTRLIEDAIEYIDLMELNTRSFSQS
jgi:uncharacterized protein